METTAGVPERLVQATITLLAEEGPSAIKARTIAAACDLSTMVVYSHFGGIPELVNAVVEHGFRDLDAAFSQAPVTEDPVADLFTMALTARRAAHQNPHLYDLMFGLSTRATYRPHSATEGRLSGRSPAFQVAFGKLVGACSRLVESGRVASHEPAVVAAQLWAYVHGFITLELAEHFLDFDDAVTVVMMPMGINLSVALGDERERAVASHEAALTAFGQVTKD